MLDLTIPRLLQVQVSSIDTRFNLGDGAKTKILSFSSHIIEKSRGKNSLTRALVLSKSVHLPSCE
jgi:hypothetical protein